ncbi:MAG: Vitamin B12 import ATP-binding protein BtuD [Steroidobacteraceae bacterium]|nr:Vitamin B12 import ATP-binding protein BtuD [Steroidobacteraceae bacterium]
MTAAIELRSVRRAFGATVAVDDVSFAIEQGEFFSMLGPSGSGKTTCLRVIAGFEQPDSGAVFLEGLDVSGTPPYGRDVNTVFQDYALFPHMSVLDNVTYGLRVRRVPAAECRRRADEMLALVKLADMGARRPAQLSGGQKQRVALARALINQPKVLLLDEPLGALDLKLREEMQLELRLLQRRLGITFVYVTHDQGEALSMSDRVAVFNRGRIEQLDAPEALYARPRTAFAARFVGGANVIEGRYAVRGENIEIADPAAPAPAGTVRREGTIVDTQYQGAVRRWQVRTDDGELITATRPDRADTSQAREPGARVALRWAHTHMIELAAD